MEQETRRSLRDLLREARQRRGLSQRALAELAQVSRGTLGSIEAGSIKHPSAIGKLAEVLEIPEEEIQRALEHTDAGREPPSFARSD